MYDCSNLASKIVFIILIALILLPTTGYTAGKYIVRFIYFKPQGAAPVDHERYDKLIKGMQEWFRDEMIRHGYGNKTFKLETDGKGDLKIHIINGSHPGEHYIGDLFNVYYEKMSKEIPFFINNTTNRDEQDNIYIIILGDVDVITDVGSTWGRAWNFSHSSLGGTAMISENFDKLHPQHFTSIIYHEFGHTLLLEHTRVEKSLMGFLPVGGPSHMEDFEARLINENHFFNEDHILNPPPVINENLQVTAVGVNTIRFSFRIKGSTNLYHAQLKRGKDYIGSTALTGKNATADIDVSRSIVQNTSLVTFLVLDENGNWTQKDFKNIQIPKPVDPEKDNVSTFKFLTLRDEHPDSITPINNESEWVGWENAGSFEKTPNGIAQKLPNWYVLVPKLDEWNSWFYSHAIARIEYDISQWNFNRFDAYFYLPNPCDGNADVKVIGLADDVEIYRSEVLRSPAAQNKHLEIDIPKDTQKFTIRVTDAGDGIGCDHFVFGEAKVLQVIDDEPETNPDTDEIEDQVIDNIDDLICKNCVPDTDIDTIFEEDLGIFSKNKLTTIWAIIKARK